MSRPRVSVVFATWNASHLLRYALESLRLGDCPDWEALVVGDHCTDDTEDVVRALGDDRIRFTNLERNSGQQATPTNVALGRARGDFVAFLNQDDLFLEHHLSINLDRMRRSDVGFVCSPYAEIPPEQRERIAAREVRVQVRGYAASGRFDPRRFHVASSWFVRRAVVERLGPWRVERQTFVTPSQDWLFRAWRRGVAIGCPREVSLIAIYSGARRDFLRERSSPEHDFVFREIVAGRALRPAFEAAVAASIARKQGRGPAESGVVPVRRRRRRDVRWLGRKLTRAFEAVAMRLGIHPNTARMILRHGGRGGYVRAINRFVGAAQELEASPPPEPAPATTDGSPSR